MVWNELHRYAGAQVADGVPDGHHAQHCGGRGLSDIFSQKKIFLSSQRLRPVSCDAGGAFFTMEPIHTPSQEKILQLFSSIIKR